MSGKSSGKGCQRQLMAGCHMKRRWPDHISIFKYFFFSLCVTGILYSSLSLGFKWAFLSLPRKDLINVSVCQPRQLSADRYFIFGLSSAYSYFQSLEGLARDGWSVLFLLYRDRFPFLPMYMKKERKLFFARPSMNNLDFDEWGALALSWIWMCDSSQTERTWFKFLRLSPTWACFLPRHFGVKPRIFGPI